MLQTFCHTLHKRGHGVHCFVAECAAEGLTDQWRPFVSWNAQRIYLMTRRILAALPWWTNLTLCILYPRRYLTKNLHFCGYHRQVVHLSFFLAISLKLEHFSVDAILLQTGHFFCYFNQYFITIMLHNLTAEFFKQQKRGHFPECVQ